MSQGFYEMLGVTKTASPDAIRSAFQGRLAALVRRLKSAAEFIARSRLHLYAVDVQQPSPIWM